MAIEVRQESTAFLRGKIWVGPVFSSGRERGTAGIIAFDQQERRHSIAEPAPR